MKGRKKKGKKKGHTSQVSEKREIGRSRGAGEVPKLIRLLVVPAGVDGGRGSGGSVNSNEDENGIPLSIPMVPVLAGITAGAAYIWYPLPLLFPPRNCSCIRRGS